MDNRKSKYNKNTYIGYLKVQNGGIKVIPGDKDNKIIANRDKILLHLMNVFSGGKKLKEKNIEKYFKALEGKYVRDKIKLPDSVKGGSKQVLKDTHKLIKLTLKKKYPVDTILNVFKGAGPKLYSKLESLVGEKLHSKNSSGGYDSDFSYKSKGSNRSNRSYSYRGGVPDIIRNDNNFGPETPSKLVHIYGDKDRSFFEENKDIYKELVEEVKDSILRDVRIRPRYAWTYYTVLDVRYQLNKICKSGKRDECNKARDNSKYLLERVFKTQLNNDGIDKSAAMQKIKEYAPYIIQDYPDIIPDMSRRTFRVGGIEVQKIVVKVLIVLKVVVEIQKIVVKVPIVLEVVIN
jgi:hypothetical protein